MPGSSRLVYGGTDIRRPVPMVSIEKVFNKNGDSMTVGSEFNMTLQGTVFNPDSGLFGVLEYQEDIRNLFANDGRLLQIYCNDELLMQCYPRINSIAFEPSNDNWTMTSPYTIQLQYNIHVENDENSSLHPPFIRSSNETWDIEFLEDQAYHTFSSEDANTYQMRVTHQVDAVGIPEYSAAGFVKPAWEYAKDYVSGRLGVQHHRIVGTGTVNLSSTLSNFGYFNHIRNQRIDERGGSYSLTETWLVLQTSLVGVDGNVIEDFTIESRINREEEDNIFNINGTIQGLETRTYGSSPGDFAITENKYAAASGYWNDIKDSIRIFPRAQIIADLDSLTLNPTPLTKTVTHSPARGEISYSYTYDDSPTNCITGAKFESIIITDNNPADVFASISVLGRSQGSILQDLNTVTDFTREVNIEIVMEKDDDCPIQNVTNFMIFGNDPHGQVQDILRSFCEDLTASYDNVFKEYDNIVREPKKGRYSRTVRWIANNCSTAPTTDLC